jgi:hypothetical protein
MNTTIRTVLLFLALSSACGLAGCKTSLAPVDLNAVERPRDRGWSSDHDFPVRPPPR